jgi:hypothetical protein
LHECCQKLRRKKKGTPVLHISAHGNERDIGLTNETFFAWEELADLLGKLNDALHGELILCMSSCEGARGWNMALTHSPRPYSALVGTEQPPTWSETAIGFATFYHLLSLGRTVKESVEGMNSACGNPRFIVIDGKEVERLRNRISQMTPEEILELRAGFGLGPWRPR